MHVNFASRSETCLTRAYTFRYKEAPLPAQRETCIESVRNESHPEGFDNVSFLTKETFAPGVKASLKCAFEGKAAPKSYWWKRRKTAMTTSPATAPALKSFFIKTA